MAAGRKVAGKSLLPLTPWDRTDLPGPSPFGIATTN
jgi:hypothetical protein